MTREQFELVLPFGPSQDSFVATVNRKQQHSVMAIRVKRCGTNGNSSMRWRHLSDTAVLLVASFRRLALPDVSSRQFVRSHATSIDLADSGCV